VASYFTKNTKFFAMPDINEKIVPPQHSGGKKDIEHDVQASDENSARRLFTIARNRLLDVNHWHEVAGSPSARFMLSDPKGIEVNRTAELHDYFKIDLPAPGHAEGDGFDWVQIEAIEEINDTSGSTQSIALRVRPSQDPRLPGENVLHFFHEQATSTFLVERKGKNVKAAVYGRNEIPNAKTDNLIDKIRNVVVGATAILGFSNLQWNALVKGLLAVEE
jgi:hypothetical protein